MRQMTWLAVAVSLLSVPAIADTVTISQMLTYDVDRLEPNGPWFIPPGHILDHAPYQRGMWEDWGWTHDVNSLVPIDANGIVSASLTIRTWNVGTNVSESTQGDDIYAINSMPPGRTTSPTVSFHTENGVITLPGTFVGRLQDTETYGWGTTILRLPADVVGNLWLDRHLRIFMDIDGIVAMWGYRVSLAYSTLTVVYSVPHTPWEPNTPVYQFWSPGTDEQFYTKSEAEKKKILALYPSTIWTYEGVGYRTYADKRDDSVGPVYRFWSRKTQTHFYTMRESERDKLMADCPREVAIDSGIPTTWIYEGIAFYAQVEGRQSQGATPVYRFWSPSLLRHLFTSSEAKKQELSRQPGTWIYEGIGWYIPPQIIDSQVKKG
jgi:hypothetical protein